MKHDESGLFDTLEKALKKAAEPMDAGELFDMAEIKECASTMRRISDYLGNMWRKGLLVRTPAPKGIESKCLWMYEWKGNRDPKIYDNALIYTPKVLIDKPAVYVTEEGDDDHFGISITHDRGETEIEMTTEPASSGFVSNRHLTSNEDKNFQTDARV